MNHIYRIVWNHATACYQAVTESAKGQGKKANTTQKSNLSTGKASLSYSILTSAFLSFFVGLANATPVVLIGDYVKTAVSDYGTLGSNGATSPGILFDLTGTRTFGVDDYLTPGSPFQFFSIKTNETGQLSNNNQYQLEIGTVSGPTNLSTSTTAKASWSGAVAGKYTVTNTYSVDVNKKSINVDTFITATSNLTGLKFVTAIDPDPDVNTYGDFATINGRGTALISAKDLVYAKGNTSGLPIGIYSNSTITHNTGVSGGWTYDPDFYLLGNNDGNGDHAIGMAFDIGSLLIGDSVHITYFYTTGGSVETIELPIFTNINTALAFYTASNLGINVNPAFEGGTLKVNASNIYAQNFTINNQGGTIDANGNAAMFSGVFSDLTAGIPGALTITDSATGGVVTLSGVNTYTGATTVSGGTLALAGVGSIATSSGVNLSAAGAKFDVSGVTSNATTIQDLSGVAGTTVNTGATVLTVGTANSTTFSGDFTGSGGLNKVGSGTLEIAGVNGQYTGATTIAGGTLALAGVGSIATSSGVNLSAAGAKFDVSGVTSNATTIQDLSGVAGTTVNTGATVLTVGTANSTTFSGDFTGSGGLNKVGSGTLEITGNSAAFIGQNTVNGGHLKVNGYLGGSSLDVGSGSLLSGSGTVGGQTTIRSGGTISPGNSIGTLSVAGGFTQEGGSNYEVQIDPSSKSSDRIAVSGSANLSGGAQLSVSKTSNQNYILETKYTILTASGGVNGKYTLSGDTAVSAFYNLQDQYDANNVYLTVAQTTPFQTAGETFNQIATGTGLQSTPNGSKLHNLIGNMQDFATARGAFDQMSGEIYASMAGARMSDASEVRQAATNRLRSAFCADTLPKAPAATSADAAIVQTCQANPEKAVRWAQVLGTRATTKGDGNAASLDHNGSGLVVGADMKVGDATRAGILFNAKNSTYSVNDRLSSARQQDVGVGIYASGKALESVNMDYRVGGTYTQHDVTTSRRVNFNGLDESFKANFKANTTQIFGEIGSRVALSSDFMIEPFASLAFVRNDKKAFDEQAVAESTALSALHSVKKSQDMAFATIGVRAAADYTIGNAKLSARGMIGIRNVIGKNVPLSTHQFSQSDEFTVAGVPVAKNMLVTEVGVGYDINEQVSMGVSYTGQFASGSRNQGLKATLEIKF